ncbi:uncharacterized protein EV154DRAFT_482171 [Mucor mucedo]|uniref:uncharacterized protein n=1 Tax=Mucor mucedo TaxID=29922 RepID=UPI002220E1F7|nr:uncharacterized protein EV154DRAFT_482171 [Mucor mucedo]KAI7890447.1 hypothetical protein EV154DRAFT_482171 [Mucor mucedo]
MGKAIYKDRLKVINERTKRASPDDNKQLVAFSILIFKNFKILPGYFLCLMKHYKIRKLRDNDSIMLRCDYEDDIPTCTELQISKLTNMLVTHLVTLYLTVDVSIQIRSASKIDDGSTTDGVFRQQSPQRMKRSWIHQSIKHNNVRHIAEVLGGKLNAIK